MIHLAHPYGVIGLALNTAAAVGLLRFTGKPDARAQFPPDTMAALRLMNPQARRSYAFEMWGYRLSLGALAIGFLLQLLDLLLT